MTDHSTYFECESQYFPILAGTMHRLSTTFKLHGMMLAASCSVAGCMLASLGSEQSSLTSRLAVVGVGAILWALAHAALDLLQRHAAHMGLTV